MLKRISIIGAGNLTQALLYSIDSSSLKMDINLYDKDKKKKVFASQKKWKFFTKVGKEIADSDIIIIAVIFVWASNNKRNYLFFGSILDLR